MPVPTGYSENAVDFLVCYKGTFLSIETKVWPRKITTQQSDFSKDIIDAGGVAVLAYDLPVIEAALAMIDDGFRCEGIMTDIVEGLKP